MITSEKELRPAHIQVLMQTMPMQDQPSLSRRAGAGCWLRSAYCLYVTVTLAVHSCSLVILSPRLI